MKKPLRQERRALWASIPKNDRPTWTEFNEKRLWETEESDKK